MEEFVVMPSTSIVNVNPYTLLTREGFEFHPGTNEKPQPFGRGFIGRPSKME
jgi:hypothetical protein